MSERYERHRELAAHMQKDMGGQILGTARPDWIKEARGPKPNTNSRNKSGCERKDNVQYPIMRGKKDIIQKEGSR